MGVLLYARVALRIVFVILNNIYTVPTHCLWMLMLQPFKHLHPDFYWKVEGILFHWLLAMVSMWSWSAGYDIVEVGDDIRCCLECRTLVIANHQSTADVPMLMATFNPREAVLPNIMWIMDRVFKFTNFGIVSVLHEDFFILSGRKAREEGITQLRNHLHRSYLPRGRKLMILFPEGGFLRKRREASQRYALKNNHPILNHVSLPRMGAIQAIMDSLTGTPSSGKLLSNNNSTTTDSSPSSSPPSSLSTSSVTTPLKKSQPAGGPEDQLSWVLDITVAYPEGKPLDLPTIIMGQRKPCQTLLFYRMYPIAEVPKEPEQLMKWLFARWEEKEKILSHYYQTGELPVKEYCTSPMPPQRVIQDGLRFFILHMFFITSTYLHYRLLTYIYALVW